jgi:hypothetical protein
MMKEEEQEFIEDLMIEGFHLDNMSDIDSIMQGYHIPFHTKDGVRG